MKLYMILILVCCSNGINAMEQKTHIRIPKFNTNSLRLDVPSSTSVKVITTDTYPLMLNNTGNPIISLESGRVSVNESGINNVVFSYMGAFRKAVLNKDSLGVVTLKIITSCQSQCHTKQTDTTPFSMTSCKNLSSSSLIEQLTISDDGSLLLLKEVTPMPSAVVRVISTVDETEVSSHLLPGCFVPVDGVCALFNHDNSKFAVKVTNPVECKTFWSVYAINTTQMLFIIETSSALHFLEDGNLLDGDGKFYNGSTGTLIDCREIDAQ